MAYPWPLIRTWLREGLWFAWPVLLLSMAFGAGPFAVTLLVLTLPVLLWPYLAAAIPEVDRTRGAILVTSCVIALFICPAAAFLSIGVGSFGAIGFGRISEFGGSAIFMVFSLLALFPFLVFVLSTARSSTSLLRPGVFSREEPLRGPSIPVRIGSWLFLLLCVAGSCCLIFFLAVAFIR
jgi:hypothetical protein